MLDKCRENELHLDACHDGLSRAVWMSTSTMCRLSEKPRLIAAKKTTCVILVSTLFVQVKLSDTVTEKLAVIARRLATLERCYHSS